MGRVIDAIVMELHQRQEAGEPMRCPACGASDLETPMERNPVSRYIHGLRFCQNCATREAECADIKNVVLDNVCHWNFLTENILPDCFTYGSPAEEEQRIEKNLIQKLCGLYRDMINGRIDQDDFKAVVRVGIPGVDYVSTDLDKNATLVSFFGRNDSRIHVRLRLNKDGDKVEYFTGHTDEKPPKE